MEWLIFVFVLLALGIAHVVLTQRSAAYREWFIARELGPLNESLVCPHCQQHGHVRTKPIERKTGISGAKATGAILTGGLSLLATGLSQIDKATQAKCGNCSSTWVF